MAGEEISETATTSRVYLPEWLVVWSACTLQECMLVMVEHYGERVRDEDWQLVRHDDEWRYSLKLLLPNLQGEFKTRELAEEFAATRPGAVVVAKNSRAEHLLQDYGVKKLIVKEEV